MMGQPGTVERAFQLAGEGWRIGDIHRALSREGYLDAKPQLASRRLTTQLNEISKRVRTSSGALGEIVDDRPCQTFGGSSARAMTIR